MRPYAFGERLREARQQRGWSQTELGKRAGVHHMLISKLERGQNQDVKGETLRKLAYALEVTTDWLLNMEDEESELLPALAS